MQVLLLMASALDVPIPKTVVGGDFPTLPKELRARQQSIAEITEMIHVSFLLLGICCCSVFGLVGFLGFNIDGILVLQMCFLHRIAMALTPSFFRINNLVFHYQVASLLHDDVLDDAETRRGISSLNFVMGNKVMS